MSALASRTTDLRSRQSGKSRQRQQQLVLVALLAFCANPADAATEQTRPSSNRIELAQFGDLFNPALRELRSLVERQLFLEAGRHYLASSASLDLNSADVQALLKAIADGLNESGRRELQNARAALDSWPQTGLPRPGEWRRMRADLNYARQVLEGHKRLPLVSDPRYQSPAYVQLAYSLSIAERNLREESWAAFRAFEHSRGSFFEQYPLPMDRRAFLNDRSGHLVDFVQTAAPDATGSLFRSYSSELPAPVKQAIIRSAMRPSADTAQPPKPYWDKLSSAAANGITVRTPSDVGAKVMLLRASGTSRLDIRDAEALPDGSLPGSVIDLDLDHSVLVIESPLAVDRKITGRRSVQSRYVSGEMRVPNPAFSSAQAEFISAQSNLNSIRTSNALNPAMNIAVAILQAAAVGAAAARVNEAQQALAATPPTLVEKVYTPYSFEVVTVSAERALEYEVLLVDRPTQSAKRIPRTSRSSRSFELAYGLRSDDPEINLHRRSYEAESALAAWEGAREAIELSLTDLLSESSGVQAIPLTQLTAVQARVGTAGTQAAAPIASNPSALIQDDPRFASVVVLRNPKGPLGTGFYVGEFLILTNYHVVEGSRIVEVKLRDGRDGVGQVERFDIGADLALIRVTQRGSPATLSVSQLTAGETVEAIGHPRGFEYSITRGVVSAVRRMRNPSVPASNELAVIQTDTPINPGNSGGPLYRGQEVIGVNTQKLRGAEGMGFAVHASEVRRFLEQ